MKNLKLKPYELVNLRLILLWNIIGKDCGETLFDRL